MTTPINTIRSQNIECRPRGLLVHWSQFMFWFRTGNIKSTCLHLRRWQTCILCSVRFAII